MVDTPLLARLHRLATNWTAEIANTDHPVEAWAYAECSRALLAEIGDHPRTEHVKVGYRSVESWDGIESTAYLDTDLGGGVWTGVNKHTDEPVTVWWSGRCWWQIPVERGE